MTHLVGIFSDQKVIPTIKFYLFYSKDELFSLKISNFQNDALYINGNYKAGITLIKISSL